MLNDWSSIGAAMIGLSTLLFVVNVAVSWKKYPAGDNPWDAQTLEWFTTSPPPHHNFYRLPQIRSERPTWDYNHPEHKSLAHGDHDDHGAGPSTETVPAP
jgi:cytochrome c oxidase subunit 1